MKITKEESQFQHGFCRNGRTQKEHFCREMSKNMPFARLTNGVPVCNIDCQHAESVQEYSPG